MKRGSHGLAASSECEVPAQVGEKQKKLNMTILWHKSLGQPLWKIKNITRLKRFIEDKEEVCLTCPLTRFTKQPYKPSGSKVGEAFELVHIDTWGSYKVGTRQGYKYSLILVDDHTRVVWVHLMETKH